ncbi:hypothetical protein V1478_005381 [Vespula squamosa]|uniref:Uncharacterized protein n=1 Tax=Vespula squamosa TaxID=30214 RepID=A0ABD2BER6_VESSQ
MTVGNTRKRVCHCRISEFERMFNNYKCLFSSTSATVEQTSIRILLVLFILIVEVRSFHDSFKKTNISLLHFVPITLQNVESIALLTTIDVSTVRFYQLKLRR